MGLLKKQGAVAQKPFEVFGDGAQEAVSKEVPEKMTVSDFEQEELLSEILGQQLRRLYGSVGGKTHRLKPRWLYDF